MTDRVAAQGVGSDPILDRSPEEIEAEYTRGRCHVMAVALSRATGLPLGAMWSGLDWHVEPDEDGLGGVREVVHVYVDCGDGDILDVRGKRPLDDMRREFSPREWMICPCGELDDLMLMDLVEQSGSLVPFDEDDVAEALGAAGRLERLRDALHTLSITAGPVP